jgi:lipopolysaccharide/colanic/teichoic acid biosynthesis glycosyltransferase
LNEVITKPNTFYRAWLNAKKLLTVKTKPLDYPDELDQLQNSPATHPVHHPGGKRTLDIVLVLLALPFLIPLALLMALLIRGGSRGPVLFRQERVGYQGRRFTVFKFRTMLVNACPSTHQGHLHQLMNSNTPMLKMDSRDPRIIPLGLWLRSSGLDELPQLINVLRGEMSLVGPRPCLPYEYDHYLPWQKERFETLPGLTGLWQVSGKNRTTFTEMIHLDIKYCGSKTLGGDLKIILMTIPALIFQMWETRRAGLASSRPVRRATCYATGAARSLRFAKQRWLAWFGQELAKTSGKEKIENEFIR